jgi:hypothetical protein
MVQRNKEGEVEKGSGEEEEDEEEEKEGEEDKRKGETGNLFQLCINIE